MTKSSLHELISRTSSFPWEALPSSIADSLKCLARSCACTPDSLPGMLFACVSTLLGSSVKVEAKEGWREPMIFWVGDIQPSGRGKTPAASKLVSVLRDTLQDSVGLAIVNDTTIAGIRRQLEEANGGGILYEVGELSSFVTSQNRFGKGNDRETWLKFWEGTPHTFRRAKDLITIPSPRINVTGGIQPEVFNSVFDGVYRNDGTLFRFLFTMVSDAPPPYTAEAWSADQKDHIVKVFEAAYGLGASSYAPASPEDGAKVSMTDGHGNTAPGECALQPCSTMCNEPEPCILRLTKKSLQAFVRWQNCLRPFEEAYGNFLPKMHAYCLRIAGILKCLRTFDEGKPLDELIEPKEMEDAMVVTHFYLNQALKVLSLLNTGHDAGMDLQKSPIAKVLARVLQNIRSQIDQGCLATGLIADEFNRVAPKAMQLKHAKAMGGLLARCGLRKTKTKMALNGRQSVYGLVWDNATEKFITDNAD